MIAWFVRNPIAANFLLIGILLIGLWSAVERLKTEVEPTIAFGQVRCNISIPGGTPENIERQVVIPIEQALTDLEGLKQLEVTIRRGSARFTLVAEDGHNLQQMRDETIAFIDTIQTFPPEAERPTYFIPNTARWKEVISVIVQGDLEPRDLLVAARQVREDLMAIEGLSKVDIRGEQKQEVSIEVDAQKLRDYGLGINDLSDAIQRSSLDLPAGSVRTESGDLLLRTSGQAFFAKDFAEIPIARSDGSEVRLGDIASIKDRFTDEVKSVRFNGKPAVIIEVTRTGRENALAIASKVHDYVASAKLPEGIDVSTWDDESVALKGRMHLLGTSLLQGMALVIILLGLFLRPSVAFWIVVGVPAAFAGALIIMPYFDVSANSMSLFGFIIVLGIVVDDAIVTGEHIFTKLKDGLDGEKAAIMGTREIATPVTFGILTTVVAFIPLAFIPGYWGEYARQIPMVVIPVLIFSLIESKLILPSHLRNLKVNRSSMGWFARFQKRFADGLVWVVERIYRPVLKLAVDFRYATLAIFAAIAASAIGYWSSGKMGMESIPEVDRYIMFAKLRMEGGTPVEETQAKLDEIVSALEQLREQFVDPGNGKSLLGNHMTSAGGWPTWGGFRENEGYVLVEIIPPEERTTPGPRNAALSAAWLEAVGDIEGAREFVIRAEDASSKFGQDLETITLEVRGNSDEFRPLATGEIADLFRGHKDIASASTSRERQQDELLFTLKPIALELGLTQRDLARQIRESFFGAEAQRLQRGVDDVRVMIRLPQVDRENLHTLESLRINLPDGNNTALTNVADIQRTPAPRRIERMDGSRFLNVYADPISKEVNINRIADQLEPEINAICAKYPGVTWRFTGTVRDNRETAYRTKLYAVLLMFALYALLAIPFKSLLQPVFVLIAVPFGVVGALLGHIILDITPSYLSIFGLLALAGVVVNDSLVMVDFTNKRRARGLSAYDAVINSGTNRFRPIVLTSLTTFAGLMPLIFERAIHAQFLIPMAVSLGFGILFATVITLFLIPCCYLALEDILTLCRKFWRWFKRPLAS